MEDTILLEEWLPVVGYEGLYEVSNLGNVYSLGRTTVGVYRTRVNKPKMLKKTPSKSSTRNDKGYLCVRLMDMFGNKKTHFVHRLVAEAFVPNPENKETVNHIDGDKFNNNVDNLEWNTYAENNQHAADIGIKSDTRMIAMLNKDGEILNTFVSIHAGAKYVGCNFRNIHAVCQGRRQTAKGYGWKYL